MLTFNDRSALASDAHERGIAIGDAAYERGERLDDSGRFMIGHCMMFGSDGYPVQKLGRGWIVTHASMSAASIFKTKLAAHLAWETMLAKFERLQFRERHCA